ncbi:MAG: hypothetical protein E6R03_04945 [Hyphomicrobiaceae bacterium]|nr:MAG: hypothetical protein E6R03_04945 [Hyphomicrobiaceae bacterium]
MNPPNIRFGRTIGLSVEMAFLRHVKYLNGDNNVVANLELAAESQIAAGCETPESRRRAMNKTRTALVMDIEELARHGVHVAVQ